MSLPAFLVQAQLLSFEYGGLERTYLLHIPANYDEDTTHPLVLNLHGLGSNAYEQLFYSQFNQVADTAGIVVAYPNGVDNIWNIAFEEGVDDVGFLSALIDTISANFNIDSYRVYATGMSMGGFMCHRLACQLNDQIAAVASVTGTLAYPNCNPGRPVPVMQIHGTADSTVPYLLVPPTMAVWISQNECTDTTTVDLPDIDTTDQCTVTKSVYAPCDEEVEVVLYTINGGGHTWPGAPIQIGITCYDIDGSTEIWNFFRQYTLPAITSVESMESPSARLKIYPQPASEVLYIQLPEPHQGLLDIRVYDLSGRMIRAEQGMYGQPVIFPCADMKAGIYIFEILSAKGSYREKVLVR